jgi:hypothetical protein
MNKKIILTIFAILILLAGVSCGIYFWNENQKQEKIVAGEFERMYKAQLNVYSMFGLEYDNITEQNGIKKIINVSEGYLTPLRIDNYNTWVEWMTKTAGDIEKLDQRIRSVGSVKDGQGNPTGKITMDDVINNPTDIKEIWADLGPMDQKSTRLVFGYNGELIIVEDTVGIHLREK